MPEASDEQKRVHTVLVVEDEVLVRMPIAQYLRECGYRVIEATDVKEALVVLKDSGLPIDVVFTATEFGEGPDGFVLTQWIHANRPKIRAVMAGTVKRSAKVAGDLCEEGPMLRKPYHTSEVERWIRRLMATRDADTT